MFLLPSGLDYINLSFCRSSNKTLGMKIRSVKDLNSEPPDLQTTEFASSCHSIIEYTHYHLRKY